ncbi:hypothetical protein [Flavobacterium sp. 270]|uniref:hypothetical protein n=1 Tax=Flavobacterium sp. 270 TaxID=2512114 RepID=UPI0010652255|nr:hypothetical protein [Flavobacterium sp. 270]
MKYFITLKLKKMFAKGQNVQQEFGNQIMKVIGFEPDLIENVITEWEAEDGTIVTGKFMESQLQVVED